VLMPATLAVAKATTSTVSIAATWIVLRPKTCELLKAATWFDSFRKPAASWRPVLPA
jgi:hypothetical protein